MATAKIITWSRPDKNGQYPIGIKVSLNGKPSYIFDGYSLPSRDLWDEKKQQVRNSVSNAARLTNFLTKKLSQIREKMLELDTAQQPGTAKTVTASVKAKKKAKEPRQAEQPKLATFQDIADQYLAEQLALGNRDTYVAERSRLKRFYEFNGNRPIAFTKITVEYLRRYTVFLRTVKNRNCKKEERSLSECTITNHLFIIRTLYNRAVTAGIIDNSAYPFGKGKIAIRFGRTVKIGLNETEIKQLSEMALSDRHPQWNNARNIWLLSYCFAGMRITDALLLKWSDFRDGRFYYVMSKNGEPGSLKIPDRAKAILDQYRNDTDGSHDLVSPYLKCLETLNDRSALRRQISYATTNINRMMHKIMSELGISKNATTHKARHSFAQMAETCKVSPKVLQKMYRHEDIKTTMIYQSNFSHEDADAALDAVVGF